MNTIKITSNGVNLTVDEQLKDYSVLVRSSSMISYIALNSEENKLYIQWKAGNGTMYSGVENEILNDAKNAVSIGKFWHANIKGQYEATEVHEPLISLATDDEDFSDHEDHAGDLNLDEIDW